MNVYVSNFLLKDELNQNRKFDLDYEVLIKRIGEISDKIILGDLFTSYEEIEENIIKSDCMIAFIDEYWSSSTWKMIEYSLASEGIGAVKKVEGFNIPIYICFSKGYIGKERFLKDKNVFELENEVEKAMETIKKLISKKCTCR